MIKMSSFSKGPAKSMSSQKCRHTARNSHWKVWGLGGRKYLYRVRERSCWGH